MRILIFAVFLFCQCAQTKCPGLLTRPKFLGECEQGIVLGSHRNLLPLQGTPRIADALEVGAVVESHFADGGGFLGDEVGGARSLWRIEDEHAQVCRIEHTVHGAVGEVLRTDRDEREALAVGKGEIADKRHRFGNIDGGDGGATVKGARRDGGHAVAVGRIGGNADGCIGAVSNAAERTRAIAV